MSLTVADLLAEGAGLLPRRRGLADPSREAGWLLARAWGVTEVSLRLHPDETVPEEVAVRYRSWLERRAAGEPAHHLTGRCDFWGRAFEVSPEVLVPRPETELLVEVALQLALPLAARVLDVGTGSGCLAVSLAGARPSWRVTALDRSLAALAVAARNIRRHKVAVALVCSDLTTAMAGPFELVLANLPYIPTAEMAGLPEEVRRDPSLALDGGDDGLALVRRLLADLERLLCPCGGAVLELGDGQAEEVAALAGGAGLAVARRLRDLGGVERVLVLQRR